MMLIFLLAIASGEVEGVNWMAINFDPVLIDCWIIIIILTVLYCEIPKRLEFLGEAPFPILPV